jgi:hypothetical protein
MTRRASDLYEFRGRWRDQVFRDEYISHAAFKVAYRLADYMTMETTAERYTETGRIKVFPRQERLAQEAHVSADTVRVAIKQLAERGHLEVVSRGNQHNNHANVYRILVKTEQARADRIRWHN